MTIRNLDALFKPDAIALVGGSDSDAIIARNLMKSGFKGPIMPVDSARWALEGAIAYRDIASLPLPPTLAVITRPLAETPELIRQLGERGVRAAVLVNETRGIPQNEREALFRAILDAAKPYLLRVLGPGSQGINVPLSNLNVSLNHQPLLPGQIAFISESGTIGQTALDIGNYYGFGFSHLIHLGDGLDVDLADILDYLAGDYRVRAILLYLEQIGDARKFMSAARRVARTKPVIVLKPHRYPEEPNDAVYDAAFRRAGLLRVEDSDELMQMVEVLKAAKLVNNDRLAILGNSSSMSLLATDTLYRFGGRLAQFSEATQEGLADLIESSTLPNPLDLGDQADDKDYSRALDFLLADPGVDGVLVIKTPSAFGKTTAVADTLIQRLAGSRRCIIASFPGPQTGAEARRRLLERQVPTYETARGAVQAFMRIVQYKRNQSLLMETPPSLPEEFTPDVAAAKAVIAKALAGGRHHLDEYETMQLLTAYGIPVAETLMARSPDEVAEAAARLNQSVALKIVSPDIAAKSQVGGVVRYLSTPDAAREAAIEMLAQLHGVAPAARVDGFVLQPMVARDGSYELTVGVRSGERFGPVIYFGQGGTEAEVIDDFAFGLPPLNMHLAREIMAQTRIYQRLRYSLLRRANLNALTLTLVKISQMIVDLDALVELHINPLWVNVRGVVALDARVQLVPANGIPRHLAIRPYPKALEEIIVLSNGRALQLRPVLPEDEPSLQALVSRASPEDLRRRFFQPIRELSHELAATLTQIDYDREMALVAADPGIPGKAGIYGIANLGADPDNDRAEYSIIVDRALMGLGLGNLLVRRIIAYARARGIGEIYGEVLQENKPMLQLSRTLGFAIHSDPDDPGLKHVMLKLHDVGLSAG
ncbi:MAG TPA: acetate--CoA ligase family protein [Candidatus Competibacter sp.]|nr:acetate--CoA ligase family protein [Candidatus Competibacter sp.]